MLAFRIFPLFERTSFSCFSPFNFISFLVLTLTILLCTSNVCSSQVNVTWVDAVGVTINGNSITKNASTGWGNGGAASLNSFTGDGGVEFTAAQTDAWLECGLSFANTNAHYNTINYGIHLRANGQIQLYENGISQGGFGPYQIGDRFTVERVGSTIFYKKNDDVFHTSVTITDAALMIDCAINSTDGEISDVKLIGIAYIGGSQSDTTLPSVPNSLQATVISVSQIDLSWDASTDDVGVTGYRIYRDGAELATTAATTYSDTGLSATTAYTYIVSAIDGAGNESNQSSSASVTTLSLPVNNPPTLDPIANVTLNEGETVTFNPTATDQDGDALTYTYTGWITSSSYTTNYNDSGTHTVTVTVSDGTLTDSQAVTVTIANTNQPPVLDTILDITVNESAAITLNPTAIDPDGDALTYTYSGWMNSASYTTNDDDTGTHTVTVTVSDGTLTDSQAVSITVEDINMAPVLELWYQNIVVNEGVTITFNPTASDADGDNLTFSYSGWMTSNSYTTNYTDAGTHRVTVTVSDGTLTDSQVVSIIVINTDVSQITVLWDANTQPELAGYKVYYGTSSQNYDTVVDVSTQTSYVLSNLVSGETYYIAVTAYDTSNYESTYSNEVIYNVPTY